MNERERREEREREDAAAFGRCVKAAAKVGDDERFRIAAMSFMKGLEIGIGAARTEQSA